MKVLYVLKIWPKLSESFILNEVASLVDRGHEVAIFAVSKGETDIQHAEFDRIDVPTRYSANDDFGTIDIARAVPMAVHPFSTVGTSRRLLSNPKQLLGSLARAPEVLSFIDDLPWSPDVIHSHFLDSQSIIAQLVSAVTDIPVTTTAHAYDIWQGDNREFVSDRMASLDRVITISEAHQRYLQNKTQTPVWKVHCGIRPAKFNPTENTISDRIVTVARFTEKKGIEFGVAAIAELVPEYPDLEWHIIGSGERREIIQNAIRTHEVEDNVTLRGNVSDEELIKELDHAEYFLLPSIIARDGDRDGIPVAAMEAMAMETIPILGEVDSTGELISHGENGFKADVNHGQLVNPEFVDAIRSALESDRASIMSAARETIVEEFNIEKTVLDLEAVFSDATDPYPI